MVSCGTTLSCCLLSLFQVSSFVNLQAKITPPTSTPYLPPSHPDEASEWEKELQQELQEYEVVTEESDQRDEQWDQEIEKMLQADDS